MAVRILNVDDNPAGRYAKSRILKFAGYDILEAENGTDALDLLVSHKPDVVLLDVNLPDISGYEVCRRIKASPQLSRAAVILTSAVFTRSSDRARGIEGGADGYLVEPIEPEIVNATIQSILRVKRAEEELRAAALQWKTTFRSISDGIALLDTDGKILRCNPASERIFDLDEARLSGKPMNDILNQLVEQGGGLMDDMLHHASRLTREARIHDRILSITFDPVFEESTRTGTVCILTDVTDARKREDDLRAAKLSAEDANQAKDRFLAALSHELRTPLTPVLLLLEELQTDTEVSPDMRNIFAMMGRNIALEARLIDDLLDLSRIVKGKLHLTTAPVDLNALIEHTTEIVSSDIQDRSILYAVERGAQRTIVEGDEARLQQILWNLVKNAIKFTGSGGNIIVRTFNPTPETVAVSVCDTGIGIAPESLGRIFTAFEQAESNTAQQFGGLGLGLAISKNLALMHGGDLTAESPGPGLGSVFTLTLPLQSAKP